jgi:thiol:disulfide interchange protein DsbD
MMMPILRLLLLLVALLPLSARAADDFLEPERAFRFSARAADAGVVEVGFDIAPGYYMYREQFKFSADGAPLGPPELPQGKVKFDQTFQKNVETYRGALRIRIPVTQASASFRLNVLSQGCADAGLCYPPMPSVATVSLKGFGGDGSVRGVRSGDAALPAGADPQNATPAPPAVVNTASRADSGAIESALQSGAFWTVIAVFFGAGVLLSLTPCVLPMLPILSSIIVGHGGAGSRGRGLALASSYSFGMALVYTAFGVAAGLAGEGLAAALQTPWVLGVFALLLVLLSLSMFGVYELRLPSTFNGGLARGLLRLNGGRIAAVFVMGGVSALIVSPCVAAPLAGALVYLSQTRDVLLGGTALFALAAGMSVPLLLVGASAGALLPRAGAWMDGIKRFFGVLLLGVALWMVQPLLSAALAMVGWGLLLLGAAVLLLTPWHGAFAWPRRALGIAAGAFALMQFVGAASGGNDPLQPLAHLGVKRDAATTSELPFKLVRNVEELDAAITAAGKPVMLDFYADWCVSCKEMEHFTFTDAEVQRLLAGFVLLKADVTKNNADDRALLRRFRLFGPPGTIFFDAQGRELTGLRVIGFQGAKRFADTLRATASPP